MSLQRWAKWLPLTVLVTMTVSAKPPAEEKQQALNIQTRLEQQLYTLPLEQQGEYALMLYRTTGNKTYLNTARVTLFLSADRLQKLAGHMSSKASRRDFLMNESLSINPELLSQFSDYFFYGFQVLPELLRIDQFAMGLKGGIGERVHRAVSGLNVKAAYSSEVMMTHYAPEIARHVYALLSLDYGDYRQLFIDRFVNIYPDSKDRELSTEQQNYKWLTMTHLVLAASDQLQEPVDDSLLSWIPDYFLNNEALLLNKGDDILLAKVGLSLLLTGHKDAVLLDKIKARVAKRPRTVNISATDFWSMLLLGWVDDYYPDPALDQMMKFKHKMPYILQPVN